MKSATELYREFFRATDEAQRLSEQLSRTMERARNLRRQAEETIASQASAQSIASITRAAKK